LRVLTPGGRLVLSSWAPSGAIHEAVGVVGKAMSDATGIEPQRFAWHESASLGELAARHGTKAEIKGATIVFTGTSPRDYVRAWEENHPMFVAAKPVLERAGTLDAVRGDVLAVLEQGNEDPAAFRVTGRYCIAEMRRASAAQPTAR
jgi:hypothetical protein